MSKQNKSFTTHRSNGIYLVFPNGNELSTVWGYGTYSDNNDLIDPTTDKVVEDMSKRIESGSNLVEVMPNCSDDVYKKLAQKFPDNENGDIFSYLTFEQWFEMINILNKTK